MKPISLIGEINFILYLLIDHLRRTRCNPQHHSYKILKKR